VSSQGFEWRRLLSVEGRLQTGAVLVGLQGTELFDAHFVNLIELSNAICRCKDLRFGICLLRAIFHFVHSQAVE
jgi:hypothetical protein